MSTVEPPSPPAPTFLAQLRVALGLFVALSLVTGVAYPLAVTAFARGLFPDESSGSLVVRDGKVLGSRLIGQPFDEPRYFWGRLSATTPHPYNAAGSGGSNLGPTNDALGKAANARIAALRTADPELVAPVPVDLVTSSASGLDPHVSPAAADYQVRRVARARGMTEARVRELVAASTERPDLALLGEPRVNVLMLNLALDGEPGR